jgi:flavin reductase (DIM6/NTAB) family NADH-FMN oxidoreductase RutF
MNAPLSRAGHAVDVTSHGAGLAAFKSAMRQLAGGVSIITTGEGDERGGLTATSVTSLSAEPPSLIVSVKQDASGLPMLIGSGRFAVSVLAHDHQHIADRFAGRDGSKGPERFAGGLWLARDGYPPVLADALASFECEVEDLIERFSHTIVIGRVTHSHTLGGEAALVYWRAAYGRLG